MYYVGIVNVTTKLDGFLNTFNVARTQSQTYVHNIPEHHYLMIVVGVGRCARVPSTNWDLIILTQMGI